MKDEGRRMKGEDFRTRTKEFALKVIRLCGKLQSGSAEIQVLRRQLVRAGTSVGSNYREACRARSKAEFISKLETCLQKADESQYWLELLIDGCQVEDPLAAWLHKESDELMCILVTMVKNRKRGLE